MAFNTGASILNILITKITNSISKPFQLNVLKQNAENVRTDKFKTKRYKKLKQLKLKQSTQTTRPLMTTKSLVEM